MLNDAVDAVGAISTLAFDDLDAPSARPRGTWLRPPGAVPESSFLKVCMRCTACQEACPYQSIRRLGPEFGEAAGTPAIIPEESPCYLCADMPCIAACEPLALQPLTREEVAMGTAEMRTADCYVAQGQPCDYCVTRCPLKSDAIGFNDAGLPEVREDGCCGCGVCAYLCPADAITIRPSQGAPRKAFFLLQNMSA